MRIGNPVRRALPLAALALVLAVPCLAAGADPPGYVPGEILVRFVDHAEPSTVVRVREALGARTIDEFTEIRVLHWKLTGAVDVETALARLASDPLADAIAYAEPNWVVSIHDYPNDPRRGELYGMHNLGQTGGVTDADIDALEAWAAGYTGVPDVVVADIDTGLDARHEDLAANVWTNPGEIAGNGVDDDGNGYVDDVHGWDFYNNDDDPADDNGHGTHTAGTIAAVGNNGIGVVGVAWNVRVMPLKVFNASGSGDLATVIKAVLYANRFPGVRVTNNSYGFSRGSNAFRDAIAASAALFACSAGNDANTRVNYPAAYSTSLPNVVAVAATDANDALASFSTYGATWVNVGAPGVNTFSTVPNNAYALKSGTSMAAPHVAGAAALLASYTGAGAAQLRTAIEQTGDPIASLAGRTTTGRRLNVARALGAAAFPDDATAPAQVGDLVAAPVSNLEIALTWTAPADDGDAGSPAYLYDVRYVTGQPITDANWASATKVAVPPLPASPGAPQTFTVGGLQPGTTYSFALQSVDEAGNRSVLSNAAEATTVAGGGWSPEFIDPGTFYVSTAFDLDGTNGVLMGTSNPPVLRFAWYDGARWNTELVDDAHAGTGTSLAVDPRTNQMTGTYGWGSLWFARRTAPNAWSIEQVCTDKASNDVTSLAYDASGLPAVAYRRTAKNTSDLRFAMRDANGTWTCQTVEANVGARYTSLAFDPVSPHSPSIAYSSDVNGDGWLDTVKYAWWDASINTWRNVPVYDTGQGGTMISLHFDPVTPGVRTIAFTGGSPSSVFLSTSSDGEHWTTELLWPGNGSDHAYAPDGSIYVGYGESTSKLLVAHRTGTTWTRETADPVNWPTFQVSIAIDPFALLPRLAYHVGSGASQGAWFTKRNP